MSSSDGVLSDYSTPQTSIGSSRSPTPDLIPGKCPNCFDDCDINCSKSGQRERKVFPGVGNICCVGAGYVGTFTKLYQAFYGLFYHLFIYSLDCIIKIIL